MRTDAGLERQKLSRVLMTSTQQRWHGGLDLKDDIAKGMFEGTIKRNARKYAK